MVTFEVVADKFFGFSYVRVFTIWVRRRGMRSFMTTLEFDKKFYIFLCFAGKPLPRVIWYRNGKLIDSSDYYDEEDGMMKNELSIAILSRSDLHADLSCETHNNNVSTPLVTTVHVDMNCKSSPFLNIF